MLRRLLPTRFLIIAGLLAAVAATGVWSSLAAAPAPGKDTFAMTALTSANGVVPTSSGNPAEWFYAYCTTSDHVIDTLHVSLVVTNTNGSVTPESYPVTFSAVGGLATKVTPPATVTMTDDGVAVLKDIGINTGSLAPGSYTANVQIDATPASKIQPSHTTVHILITVGPGCGSSSTSSCFFTDSDFNLFHDCAGAEVTLADGGTFQIVANGKKITATNPGQFYYNMIWTNGGVGQPVTINLSAVNLTPMGANSVHAYVFDTAGFSADLTSWELVNSNGTPCGPSGPCTVTVPSGKTLWVTWHVEYAKVGQPPPNTLTNDCTTSTETVSATCVLTDADNGTPLARCAATAKGYLKK